MSQTNPPPPQIALSSRAQSNTFVSQGVWTFALRADPPRKKALPGICPSLGRVQTENSVTATEVLVWRPLLADRGRITKQSSVGIPVFVGRLERKLFQLATKAVVDRSRFSCVGRVFNARDAATEKAVSPIRRHAAASTIEFFYININYIMNDRLTVWANVRGPLVR